MNIKFQFLWLLVFMLLPLQSVFAVVKSDVAIITTPFVLPAKITMLQAIAKDGEVLSNQTAYWRLKDYFQFVGEESEGQSFILLSKREQHEVAS